jgi:hypothetical protein
MWKRRRRALNEVLSVRPMRREGHFWQGPKLISHFMRMILSA